jgi:hypothetical protein
LLQVYISCNKGVLVMVLIVGLFAGLALFYFWLRGQWFARWLVAIALVIPGCWIFMAMIGAMPNQQPGLDYAMTWAFGLGFAWLVASLPTFFWRAEKRAQARRRPIQPEYIAPRHPTMREWEAMPLAQQELLLGRVQQRVL